MPTILELGFLSKLVKLSCSFTVGRGVSFVNGGGNWGRKYFERMVFTIAVLIYVWAVMNFCLMRFSEDITEEKFVNRVYEDIVGILLRVILTLAKSTSLSRKLAFPKSTAVTIEFGFEVNTSRMSIREGKYFSSTLVDSDDSISVRSCEINRGTGVELVNAI